MNEQIYDSELLLSHLSEIIDRQSDSDKKENLLITKLKQDNYSGGIHLAIFIEPYLQYITEGKKTVEARFSINCIAPFKKIYQEDLILLKKSSGPIVGFCFVKNVWFYELNPLTWKKLRESFEAALCIQNPLFWESKKKAKFGTLIKLGEFNPLSPIKFQKQDRRGWVILKPKELKDNKKNQIELLKFT